MVQLSSKFERKGLRILIINPSNGNPSKFVVVGSKMIKPIFHFNQIINPKSSDDHPYCFLKSCHLCHKPLTLDKQVYMYRGDLGFCSVECRERQMYMDEMKDLEILTKKMLAPMQQRQCESHLREEFRHGCRPFLSQNTTRVVFSYT